MLRLRWFEFSKDPKLRSFGFLLDVSKVGSFFFVFILGFVYLFFYLVFTRFAPKGERLIIPLCHTFLAFRVDVGFICWLQGYESPIDAAADSTNTAAIVRKMRCPADFLFLNGSGSKALETILG